jgi:hypothetical protein
LLPNSPCIDAGAADGLPITDILGHPRIGLPDIGAYEYPGETDVAAEDWVLYR